MSDSGDNSANPEKDEMKQILACVEQMSRDFDNMTDQRRMQNAALHQTSGNKTAAPHPALAAAFQQMEQSQAKRKALRKEFVQAASTFAQELVKWAGAVEQRQQQGNSPPPALGLLAPPGLTDEEFSVSVSQPGDGESTISDADGDGQANPFDGAAKLTLSGLSEETPKPIPNNATGIIAGMRINLDGGSIPGGKGVYGPNNTGYELTQNAGWWKGEKLSKGIVKQFPGAVKPGTDIAKETRWFGIVTDKNGNPVVQGPNDPNPGYYITQTALVDNTLLITDPRRYFNSFISPGIVSPYKKEIGLIATVVDTHTGAYLHGIVYDKGPGYGEASLHMAQYFGIVLQDADNHWVPSGDKNRFLYFVYQGSRQNPAWPLSNNQLNSIGNQYMRGNPNVQKAIDDGLDYVIKHPRK